MPTDKLNILMIDDDATSRMLAKEYLEEAGHQLRQAEDGPHGLKLATKVDPDVILLDLLLPSTDGYSLCRTLKKAAETSHIPIILITAARERDVIEKGFEAGADDFVTKPVDWAFLSDRVINVLRKSREHTELVEQAKAEQADPSPAPASPELEPEAEPFDELLDDADPFSDQFEFIRAAVREQMAEQHAEELARAVSDARAEVEAEMSSLQRKLEQKLTSEAEAEREAHDAAILEEREEAVAAAVEAERAQAEIELENLRNEVAELKSQAQQADALEETLRSKDDRLARDENTIAELTDTNAQLKSSLAQIAAEHSREIGKAQDAADKAAGQSRAAWAFVDRWLKGRGTVIAGIASQVRGSQSSENASAALSEVEKALLRLKRDFVKMKVISAACAFDTPAATGSVDVSQLMNELMAEPQKVASARNIELTVVDDSQGAIVKADAGKLRYCIMNLVLNAIRFTPAGGQVELRAGTNPHGQFVIETVDNGVGIAPAALERHLHRLDCPVDDLGTAPDAEVGLGIPTVVALSRSIGCEARFDSKEGKGTRAALVFGSDAFTSARDQTSRAIA